MKKNAMLKIAAILMVAVLLTTCAISSTFAKYVTSDKDDAEARVAKWGVSVDVDADDAFAKNYGTGLVVSNDYVIAPGTGVEKAIVVTASGTPEVKTEVVFNDGANGKKFIKLGDNWEVTLPDPTTDNPENTKTEDYFPVVFVINGTKYATADSGLTAGDKIVISNSITALETKINEVIGNTFNTEYAANTEFKQSLTIGWYWGFTVDNVKDTALGDAAAKNTEFKIEFDMDITIAQAGPAGDYQG